MISPTLTLSRPIDFYSFKKVISVERQGSGRAKDGEKALILIIISDHTKSLMSLEKIKHVHTKNFYITLQWSVWEEVAGDSDVLLCLSGAFRYLKLPHML